MNIQSYKLKSYLKILTIVGAFVFSFAIANQTLAADGTIRAKNTTHTSYSNPTNSYASSVRAEPNDVLSFRFIYNSTSATPASSITVTLPADLTYADSLVKTSGTAISASVSGQNITFSFSPATLEIFTFNATVASGQNLSTDHSSTVHFTTNGSPAADDSTVTTTTIVQTGPIIKSITPATGNSLALTVALKGHGFKQVSDIASIVLSPGSYDLVQPGMSVSGPDSNGLYTISGLHVPADTPAGTYYVVLSTSGFDGVAFAGSNVLPTEADTNESAAFVVDLGNPVITTYSANQNSDTSGNVKAGAVVLTATFDEALSVVPKIAINQPGTTDISATDMTLVSGNTYNYTYTVQTATGGTYVDGSATVTISGATDVPGNVMTNVNHTLVIDTTKPTVQSYQIVEGANNAGTVMAGTATITIVMDGAVAVVPKIAINQPGATDIAATDMTLTSGNTYTYDYTVHSATEAGYTDGTATVTITAAADSFGNAMNPDATHTFTINTLTPIVSNYTITQGANTSGYVKAGSATISITMSEAMAIVPKIAINQPGTTDISATDMTLASGNTYTYAYTVQAPTGGTYVDGTANVTISNAATSLGNTMVDSAHTFVIDNVKPTVSLTSVAQDSNSSGSIKTGNAIITITANETLSVVPKIAIDQPGSTDILATDMALTSGNIYNYTYTANAANGGTYIDGTATMTITLAADRAGNVMDINSANTFTIDTTAPTPVIANLAFMANGQTAATFSWTPTYTASDFSTYKFYYRTATGVTSANGTEITKNTSNYSSLGTASTNSLSLTGLTAATHYYAVIYICDIAGNCSSASNEADGQTENNAVINVAPAASGGGGGGGGSSTPSAPSTASSAGTITASGGAITTTTSSGTSAMVSIPANTVSGNVNVAEASSTEKQAAPLPANQGVIIGNSVFNIQLSGTSSPTFTNPVTLEFVYDPAQLGGINPSTLNISYFSATLSKWVSLVSSVNTTTHKVAAQTTHFTLFAITTVPPTSGSTTNTTPTPPAETTTTTPPATTEPGQVLGSSVGVYPNGSLLKAPNSPAVFYISNDQKHVITSAAVFNTRFNWNDIVYLPSTRQLDLYEAGDAVAFSVGTLAKEEGKSAVYRISATAGRQPILSANVFLKRGYKWNQVIEVAPNALASYPEQAYISSADNFYTGDVVKIAATAKIYQIETGSARLVPNVDVLQANKLDKKPIRNITAKEFKQFTAATDLFYPDGTLVKGSTGSAVYIISDGRKRAFASGADFDALLYNRKQIKVVADKALAAIESVSPIKLAQKNIHTASAE